jgi:hypothetical protein
MESDTEGGQGPVCTVNPVEKSLSMIQIGHYNTVHITGFFVLDNDQRDAHLLYFTIYLSHSSTCFEHYMLIIRRLNFIDVASGIVL